MGKTHEELVGEICAIKASGETNGSHWVILELEDYTKLIGSARADQLIEGVEYRFFGHWNDHPKYGRQFSFSSCGMIKPATRKAVKAYLREAPGIGEKIAESLWTAYGANTIERCKDPANLAGFMPQDRAVVAANWLAEHDRMEGLRLRLNEIFSGHSLPRSTTDQAIDRWGAAAPDLIEQNPFILTQLPQIGFKRADAIWQALGLPLDSPIRGAYCAWFAVSETGDGSIWYSRPQVCSQTQSFIGTGSLSADQCIDEAIERNLLSRREKDGEVWYADRLQQQAENNLSIRSLEIHASLDDASGFIDQARNHWPDIGQVPGLSDHQAEQLAIAISAPLGILTGGPGVGKTYTVAQLVKAVLARGSGGVAISCPTGKAAVRCREALRMEGVGNIEPSTIHRRLKWSPQGFGANRGDPLPEMLHILDEQSMCPTDLLGHYFDAVRSGSQVLLVLDPYQLPPVGPGCPALDLIQWGIPTGKLTEPRRNCGKIVECCMDIRNHKRFVCSSELDLDAGENLLVTGSSNAGESVRDMYEWIDVALTMGFSLEEIQVLAPMTKRGELCTKELNRILQNRLNSNPEVDGWDFRIGDKAICTTNGEYSEVHELPAKKVKDSRFSKPTKDARCYVANGEQGIVEEISKKLIVRFPYPDRYVAFGKSDPVELAWAITCHKSQGSEWPVTIVMFDPAADRMGTMEWVTTAISRAKKFCVGVGKRSTPQKWVTRTGLRKRKTFQQQLMTEYEKENWERKYANRGKESRQPAAKTM